jgi:hypothetical protein
MTRRDCSVGVCASTPSELRTRAAVRAAGDLGHVVTERRHQLRAACEIMPGARAAGATFPAPPRALVGIEAAPVC